jgi:hypothetical protein
MVLLVIERPVAAAAKSKINASFWRFPKSLLEVFACDRLVQPRQLKQLISDPSHAGSWCLARNHDTDLRGLQSHRGADFLSGGVSLGPLGEKKCVARLLLYFRACLSWLCADKRHPSGSGSIRFLWMYEGVCRSVGKALASAFIPEHLRAGGIGWFSAKVGSLQLIASVVAGLLWDQIGHVAVFYYGLAAAVVGSIALILLVPERRNPTSIEKPAEQRGP